MADGLVAGVELCVLPYSLPQPESLIRRLGGQFPQNIPQLFFRLESKPRETLLILIFIGRV